MKRRDHYEADLKSSWDWMNFAAGLPSNPQQITQPTGNQLIYSGRCILTGAAFVNSATTAGTVQLLDGQDATGTIVSATALAASGVGGPDLPAQGVLCELGVYLVAATVTLKGSVMIIPLAHYNFTPPGT